VQTERYCLDFYFINNESVTMETKGKTNMTEEKQLANDGN
jgi:hypothetical protein